MDGGSSSIQMEMCMRRVYDGQEEWARHFETCREEGVRGMSNFWETEELVTASLLELILTSFSTLHQQMGPRSHYSLHFPCSVC